MNFQLKKNKPKLPSQTWFYEEVKELFLHVKKTKKRIISIPLVKLLINFLV